MRSRRLGRRAELTLFLARNDGSEGTAAERRVEKKIRDRLEIVTFHGEEFGY
jgi:hypothetical protein